MYIYNLSDDCFKIIFNYCGFYNISDIRLICKNPPGIYAWSNMIAEYLLNQDKKYNKLYKIIIKKFKIDYPNPNRIYNVIMDKHKTNINNIYLHYLNSILNKYDYIKDNIDIQNKIKDLIQLLKDNDYNIENIELYINNINH